ncbi:NAD(P)/FAD-dependent oxidoreductase [Streptacidiphilus sp. MAP5-3]|uniref:NAD(P)/FAD-dependent oxidoreductase n=1 Tax=unclassified Streptacidiphilus TaxID=2643834 RepID=UPI003519CC57
MPTGLRYDVVVIGAGIIGAACADALTSDPAVRVAVVDRGPVSGGTTGAGEGNLLVSDKLPGPELDLALAGIRLWRELAEQLGAQALEYEPKGGLVVASEAQALGALRELAEGQRKAGVAAEWVPAERLGELEPQLAPDLAGGIHYPQDAQVQPARAAASLLRRARDTGRVDLLTRTDVIGLDRGRVLTDRHGTLHCDTVVNAAGTWGGEVAALAGSTLPVRPRRGFVLVTEPLPPLVRHKVYAADYVADVASGSADLQSSAVVEGTAAGPVLIGATRERVGFDRRLSVPALARLAAQATALFPALASVRAIRAYRGFRPYLPDHLPAIGRDAVRSWLFHACGHEGAGVGLAPATGLLIAQLVRGERPFLDPAPFDPARFAHPQQEAQP